MKKNSFPPLSYEKAIQQRSARQALGEQTTKTRPLTSQQALLLNLDMAGHDDEVIASHLSVTVDTVCKKRAALMKGISLNAYSNLPELPCTGDLFN